MPFSISDLALGVLVPIVTAAVVAAVIRAIPWGDNGHRQAPGWALVVGFALGYGLLKLGRWQPEDSYEWILYVVAAAAICGPLLARDEATWYERITLFGVIAISGSWFLVPTWQSLEPSRLYWLLVTTLSIVAVACCVEILAKRLSSWWLGLLLAGTGFFASVLLMLSGSAKFAQIAMAFSGALVGLGVMSLWRKDDEPIRGIGLGLATGLIGMLMLGRVYSFSKIPTGSYALIAFAPLPLLLTVVPPLRKWEGAKLYAVSGLACGAFLIGGIILAVVWDPSVIETE